MVIVATRRIITVYYIALFVFFAILTMSYLNITSGGAVLWAGPYIFYLCMLIFASSLTYVILTSSNNYLKNLELPGVLLFYLSLPLLLNIGIHMFPSDLDSIISIQTIPFIINNGFSAHLVGDQDLLISGTYSLPLLSILSASFMQILGITYIATAKYIPIILSSIFFLIYYSFVSKCINKKVALLSLMLISTFIWNYSGIFVNCDLALILFVLSWWFLLWRDHYNKSSVNIVIIQIIVLLAFVITHHLTYAIFVISAIFLSLYSSFTTKQMNTVIVGLLTIVLMLSYYIFVYLLPLELILNAFTNQLVVEGKAMTKMTEWTFPLILQRTSYVIFLIPPTILSIIEIKNNFRNFLLDRHVFLVTGIFLFLFSILLVINNAPVNWERITIFAWMLYFPGAINILSKSEILKRRFTRDSIIIFTLSLLVLGNLYAIPIDIIDHSGDHEYEGSFKNWIKIQEWNSGLWVIKYGDNNRIVIGDEPVRRIYLTHSPNFKGYFKFMPNTFNEIKTSGFTYMVIRTENFYQVVGGFYVAKGTIWQKYAIKKDMYEKISSYCNINLIYDNDEVEIFYRVGD